MLVGGGFFDDGTTSAYAENTRSESPHQPAAGNYLRVRGEYLPVRSP